TAALLPGTAFFLGLPYAPARKFLETGVRVALASDFNPGSSMGPNLQLVMTMAVSQMKMSPEEALLGVTLHGACAMGLEQEVGSRGGGRGWPRRRGRARAPPLAERRDARGQGAPARYGQRPLPYLPVALAWPR